MPFDFPDTPTPDQIVIGPNQQLYRWDGTKWVHHQKPSRFVERAGDTMTGHLFLNDDGSQPLHPVTFRQLGTSVEGTKPPVTATPPENPGQGQLWFNPSDIQLYIFFGTHWVVAVNPPILPQETEPETPPETPPEPPPTP